jgi:hypothetical protein
MTQLHWPFLGSEALTAKSITERAMRRLYQAVYPDVYVPCGVKISASQRAEAAWLWSRRRGIVGGQSAAALLGAKWVNPSQPAELIYDNRRSPPLVTVHTATLLPAEVVDVGGIPVTSPARTAFDIGRRTSSRLLAVQRLDALANATDVKAADVEAVMAHHPGARGLVRLRKVLPLVDGGAESPQETRTRLILTDAGLPAPHTQIVVLDEFGDFVARVDMGYEELRIGVEYDGPQHWTDPETRTADILKAVKLQDMGWIIIRVNRDILRYQRATFEERVRAAMRTRGCRV